MRNRIALVLAAVVVISGCAQVVNDLNRFDSVDFNYRHEIELQTSDLDTAQRVVEELRERHENMEFRSHINVKPNQSTEKIRYYIETVDDRGPEIERSISEMNFTAQVPFVVQGSRTLNLGEPMEITRSGEEVSVSGETLNEGETVEIQDYNVTLNNTGQDQATVHINVLERSHIVRTTERSVQSGVSTFKRQIRGQLSGEGAERLQTVLQNYNSSEDGYLQNLNGEDLMITPVVQGERMQSLIVSDRLKQRTRTIAVRVSGETRSEVEEKGKLYQTVLDSSELETGIEYINVERINQEEN